MLVREHGQLKAVKVKEVSNIALQGNWIIPIAISSKENTTILTVAHRNIFFAIFFAIISIYPTTIRIVFYV